MIQRVKLLLDYFSTNIGGDNKTTVSIMKRVVAEAFAEVEDSEVPPEILEFYMKQAAAVVYWGATGEHILNMPLPEEFVDTIPEELNAASSLALEAAPE